MQRLSTGVFPVALSGLAADRHRAERLFRDPTKSETAVPGPGIVTPRQSNPLCRCAPSAGEVNIILVVTSILRVRNKVVDVGVSLTRRPYTARRLAFDHWSIAPRTTALQSALNC